MEKENIGIREFAVERDGRKVVDAMDGIFGGSNDTVPHTKYWNGEGRRLAGMFGWKCENNSTWYARYLTSRNYHYGGGREWIRANKTLISSTRAAARTSKISVKKLGGVLGIKDLPGRLAGTSIWKIGEEGRLKRHIAKFRTVSCIRPPAQQKQTVISAVDPIQENDPPQIIKPKVGGSERAKKFIAKRAAAGKGIASHELLIVDSLLRGDDILELLEG